MMNQDQDWRTVVPTPPSIEALTRLLARALAGSRTKEARGNSLRAQVLQGQIKGLRMALAGALTGDLNRGEEADRYLAEGRHESVNGGMDREELLEHLIHEHGLMGGVREDDSLGQLQTEHEGLHARFTAEVLTDDFGHSSDH